MGRFTKGIWSVSLAVMMTAATISGCAGPVTDQSASMVPTSAPVTAPQQAGDKAEPTLPVTRPSTGNTEDVVQLRLLNVRPDWISGFETDNGTYLLADSVVSLLDGLSRRGVDASKLDLKFFDNAFFAEYRLVVIPRRTSSGSVRFGAQVEKTADGVKITPVGTMPEVGTADMADWLILVPLSIAQYPGTVTVENAKQPASNSQRYAIHRY